MHTSTFVLKNLKEEIKLGMKTKLTLLASLIALYSCAAGELGHKQNNERIDMEQKKELSPQEEQALATARSLVRMMIARDIEGMRAVLAEGMYLRHITGYKQPREEWIEEVRSESMKYYSAQEDYARTRLVDSTTVEVSMAHQLDARIWGNRRVWPLKQKMTLARQGEGWIIISSEASL